MFHCRAKTLTKQKEVYLSDFKFTIQVTWRFLISDGLVLFWWWSHKNRQKSILSCILNTNGIKYNENILWIKLFAAMSRTYPSKRQLTPGHLHFQGACQGEGDRWWQRLFQPGVGCQATPSPFSRAPCDSVNYRYVISQQFTKKPTNHANQGRGSRSCFAITHTIKEGEHKDWAK